MRNNVVNCNTPAISSKHKLLILIPTDQQTSYNYEQHFIIIIIIIIISLIRQLSKRNRDNE